MAIRALEASIIGGLSKAAPAAVALFLTGSALAQSAATPNAVAAQAPRLVVQSGPRNPIGLNIALSPDKRLMATAGGDVGAAYIWQVETGRLLCTVKAGMGAGMAFMTLGLPRMAFSADGSFLATASQREISVWDVRACRIRGSLPQANGGGEDVNALLTLNDGQLLAVGSNGTLFKGDVFAGAGNLQALPKPPHRSDVLHGQTRDGRHVLTSGRDDADSVSPFAPSALRVVDVQTGAVDNLAAYRGVQAAGGGFITQMLPRGAAISRSGRWVIESHQGVATLYDRQGRVVAGRAPIVAALASGAPAGKPATQATEPDPFARIDAKMAEMLKKIPPALRADFEEQMKAAVSARPPAANPAARPSSGASPGPSSGTIEEGLASWVGFSAKEDLVFLWKNPGQRGAVRGPLKPDQVPIIEARRVPTLELVKAVPISDPYTVNREASGVAMSFAPSSDGSSLAVSLITGDMAGGRTGVVDLTQLPDQAVVRAWKPTGNGPGRIEWTNDGRLVAVHGGALGGGNTASMAGRSAPGAAQVMPGAGAPEGVDMRTLAVRWSLDSGEVDTRSMVSSAVLPSAVSAGGGFVAVLKADSNSGNVAEARHRLEVVASQTLQPVSAADLQNADGSNVTGIDGLALSPDGRRVAVLTRPQESRRPSRRGAQDALRQRLSLHDAATGRSLAEQTLAMQVGVHGFMQPKMRFTADGKTLIVVGDEREGDLMQIELSERGEFKVNALKTGAKLHDVEGDGPLRLLVHESPERGPVQTGGMGVIRVPQGHRGPMKFNASGTQSAAARDDGSVQLFSVAPGGRVNEGARLVGHVADVVSLAFSPDGRRLASSDEQGSTFIWDLASGAVVARLFAFSDGSWAVVDSQGRFDTNRVEDLEFLHWVMPDDPLRALPLDIFMREYFAPGLLARLMRNEALPAVRPVGELNRAQPVVRIAAIVPSREDRRRVDVTVDTEGRLDAAGRPGGVADLRLFREGRLVGYPQRAGEPLPLDPKTQRASVTFRNIQLPQGAESVLFSAYAFNTDAVKGLTAHSAYPVPAVATSRQKGKAYLITIGVNRNDNPGFSLRYAANDARLAGEVLSSRLVAGRGYREVVVVPLISDGDRTRNAGKARIRAVLAVLAGKPVDRSELAGIPQAAALEAATPDDLVIVTFAGHGHAGERGVFYLLPQDMGGSGTRQFTPQMLGQAISSDELEIWLRDVDAGEMAMVIDACHSAASVEGDGFKAGPMGSRGLGQLAYDKGLRILAASQADDVALETDTLQHGLLTFVLMRDGIEARRADHKPVDNRIQLAEWLAFGVQGVPQLQREMAGGKRAADGSTRAAIRQGNHKVRIQQPRLFDFSRQGDGPAIEVFR
jgi:WD40 repeat protein